MHQVLYGARSSWNLPSKSEAQEVYKVHQSLMAHRSDQREQNTTAAARSIPPSKVAMESQHRKHSKQKQQTIDRAISEMIQIGMRKNMLEKLEMFFISVNYFCKTQQSDYVPAEMAIIRYSLENGILGQFHELINPARLPLGLTHEASEYSEETHALPLPPNALGETDFRVILKKLLAFTGYNKPRKLFPFVTEAREVTAIESVLTQLNRESNAKYQFLVIPLEEFFLHLKRGTEKYGLDISIFPDKVIADMLLRNDAYEYSSGIACDFHDQTGNPKFCALSKAIRWTYIISNNCCPDLSIELIPGCHLPTHAESSHFCKSLPSIGSQFDKLSVSSSVQLDVGQHTKNPSTGKETADEDVARNMDSFYMVEGVDDSLFPVEDGAEKQKKLIPVRQLNTGRGRGILLENNWNEPTCTGFPVKGSTGKGRGEWLADDSFSSALQGAGRGQNLLIGSTPFGIDPTYCRSDSMGVPRGRGLGRKQPSMRQVPPYRQPYSQGRGDSQIVYTTDTGSLGRQSNGREELLNDSFASVLKDAGFGNDMITGHVSIDTYPFPSGEMI